MNPMGSLHNRGPTQGSTSNLYNQFPANSNSTFSTFRQSDHSRQGRHCYATRHGGENRRRHDSKHEPNGYRSDGYKSDGDGYKSDIVMRLDTEGRIDADTTQSMNPT